MKKRTIAISTMCVLLALPSGALAEVNPAQTPQSINVDGGKQGTEAVNSTLITALADDFSGPVLEGLTVSPTTVAVGDTVTFSIKASDVSGVAEVYAYMNTPNGRGFKEIPLVLDTAAQEWKGTYTIDDLDQEGTWLVDFISYDTLGNYTWEVAPDSVVVNNPNGDAELPTIGDVVVSPLNVGPEEEFTIRAMVNDNVAVGSVYASVYSVDGFGGSYYLPLTFEESTNEWVVSHFFTGSDMPGNWYIDILVEDTAGNYADKILEEVLVLSNQNADFTVPTIGAETFTPAVASPGDSVQVRVPVTDSQSGVSTVYAEFTHVDYPFDVKTLFLTQDPLTGEWVGDLNIDSSFQSGVWKVVFYAADNTGNSTFKENFSAFDVINNDGDFEAPVISDVQVTPQGDVQVGESVTVTAKVSDNVGVDSVRADLYTQGGFEYIDLTYDEANDQWTGSLVIQETTTPGFYLASISAWDTSFNFDFITAEGGFTVVNTGDHTGPVVSVVEIDKPEVNAGEQVTISATVEDIGSGVASVTAYYGSNSIDLAFDSTLQKWVGTISVPMNVPDGNVIQIDMIEAVDSKGNPTVQFLEGVSYLVHNPDGDFTVPVVDSFVLTPSTVKPGESVHFEAKLTDDKSGIKSAIVDLFNNTNPEITSVDLTYDEANDVWSADYVIPANAVLGSYSVSLNVEDNAGNVVDYSSAKSLLIVDEHPDNEAPKFESITISPDGAVVGDEVTFKVNLTDNLSGVKNARVILFNPDTAGSYNADDERAYRFVDLTFEEQESLWIGTYTVKPTDPWGAWDISYEVEDHAGNTNQGVSLEKLVVLEYTSPMYKEAVWYYDTKSYYNAVYYAGAAIAEGDRRSKVQDLMNKAAQALSEAAATMESTKAKNAYKLLSVTAGVPSDIQAGALEKLNTAVSPKYREAAWYYNNQNYYNAVYIAGAAIAEGDKTPEIQNLMSQAATALFEAAATMESTKAKNAYKLLSVTAGVPSDIQAAALEKLNTEVVSPKYKEAAWYYNNQNYYNAVYYAGAAITEGDKTLVVQDLMNKAAKALFEAAATMESTKAKNAYKLLSVTAGVPSDIQAAALEKLNTEVVSPKYKEAAWYYNNQNYYNAVYYAGAAITEGDKTLVLQDLMNKAAKVLFEAAATMESTKAKNAYKLLSVTAGVPSDIQTAALEKLNTAVSPKYREAAWYYNNQNYYNAVYYAGVAIAEGDNTLEVQNLINKAARALFEAAATMESTKAQNAYKLLSETTGVPNEIKVAAAAKLNP